MAYQQGGVITYTDYNNLVGTNPSSAKGILNSVWGTGSGDIGYGQTAVTQSAATGGTVSATQWATLINSINNASKHQSAGGANPAQIGTVSPGNTIQYLGSIGTALNTLHDNRLNFSSQGSTQAGTVFGFNPSSGSNPAALQYTAVRTVSFASGDAARYFFNAGGKLNFVTTGVSNNDGQGRSADVVNLVQNNLGSINGFGAHSNGGRTGSGGTVSQNNTGQGYYESQAGEFQSLAYIISTNYPYSGDWAAINAYTSAQNASGNGDKGATLYFKMYINLGALQSDFGNKGFNVTWNHRIDVVYPESTNLSSSWGTVSIS
jgi:hypothetical protein